MSDTKFSALLRSLAKDYADRLISREQYRARRHVLIRELDQEYNGLDDKAPVDDIAAHGDGA